MTNTRYSSIVPPKSSKELLDMYFLEARSHLLETAAILDRIQRGKGGTKMMDDPKISTLKEICRLLMEADENRAEQVLNHLSV